MIPMLAAVRGNEYPFDSLDMAAATLFCLFVSRAGGTGGSNTAGLGGRGGPYRLDKGHKVHQVFSTL